MVFETGPTKEIRRGGEKYGNSVGTFGQGTRRERRSTFPGNDIRHRRRTMRCVSKILLSRRGDIPVGREEHRVGGHAGARARVGETAAKAADGGRADGCGRGSAEMRAERFGAGEQHGVGPRPSPSRRGETLAPASS